LVDFVDSKTNVVPRPNYVVNPDLDEVKSFGQRHEASELVNLSVPVPESNMEAKPETGRTEHTAEEVGLFDQNKQIVDDEAETKWTFKAPSAERKSVYSTTSVNQQISFKPGQ